MYKSRVIPKRNNNNYSVFHFTETRLQVLDPTALIILYHRIRAHWDCVVGEAHAVVKEHYCCPNVLFYKNSFSPHRYWVIEITKNSKKNHWVLGMMSRDSRVYKVTCNLHWQGNINTGCCVSQLVKTITVIYLLAWSHFKKTALHIFKWSNNIGTLSWKTHKILVQSCLWSTEVLILFVR